MKINFTKMHGCGNDYIYVNCFDADLPHPEEIAKAMSPRRFSVGSDGLILICPSSVADAKMRMFNLDGSEGKMCGNGIRCVGKFLYDNGIVQKSEIDIETLSGIKHLRIDARAGRATDITVDMGIAITNAPAIPVLSEKTPVVEEPLKIDGKTFDITCVSMGNPHAVTFVDDIDGLDLEKIGPLFERNAIFPEGVNTEFIEFVDKNTLRMRVWERGSGETLACGTGACASVVAAILCGKCEFDSPVAVHLRGGTLIITVKSDFRVYMRGSAVKVYEGVYEYEYQDK
ncbi:MAG: diaminopimelate epimerase [Clostridia bacterium]|nr:diaminopimelate epimerase [Clostridia bacterium]